MAKEMAFQRAQRIKYLLEGGQVAMTGAKLREHLRRSGDPIDLSEVRKICAQLVKEGAISVLYANNRTLYMRNGQSAK